MMKNIAKITLLSVALVITSVAIGSNDTSSVQKELVKVKAEIKKASGANKERLMKRMAKLENKLTESSSADRKQSK